MQWLLALETDNDPISICRLMNVFRRKSVRLVTLSLATAEAGFSLLAVVETPQGEVDHLFHFLRSSAGVENVTCYLPSPVHESGQDDPAAEAASSYLFIGSSAGSLEAERISELLPGCGVIFSSEGKLLFEVPAGNRSVLTSDGPVTGGSNFVHLVRAKDTRVQAVSELVA
jgi:hypothetical protein